MIIKNITLEEEKLIKYFLGKGGTKKKETHDLTL